MKRRIGWLGVLLLLTAGGAPAVSSATILLPDFDPSALEPAVAEQLTALNEHVESVLAAEPEAAEAAEAVGELGRHYHAYQLVDPAEQCFRTAADLAPQDFRWHYHLGYLLQSAGRPEEAAIRYERALEIVPGVTPALIRLGEVYRALNRQEEAIAVLEQALAADSTASAAHAVLGEIQLSKREYRQAADHLEAALELESRADLLDYPLALAYRGLGDEDRARELIAKRGKVGVRAADPLIDGMTALTTGERVHLLRGRSAFGAGRWTAAVEEFELAVAANPESVSGLVNLGTALAQAGESEKAIESYRRAIELGPGNATARFNLGTLLSRLGRLEEAREELRGALLYAPDDGVAHLELGGVLVRLGRPEDALLHLDRAVASYPASEGAQMARARALLAVERWGEAVASLEEARAALPASRAVAYALARLLAACPDASVRDGARAVELALDLHEEAPGPTRAALVASSMAEAGRCAEAADWQRRAVDSAAGASQPDRERMLRRLAHYEGADPCRPPVSASFSQQP